MKQRHDRREGIAQALIPYLPAGTATTVAAWIVDEGVQFVIAKPRQSKLGDFRAGSRQRPSRISVNGDLHPYAFLITTVHEFAHLQCFKQYGHSVAPHGTEWKTLYVRMLKPFMQNKVFTESIHTALEKHIASPSASSCSCSILHKALALHADEQATFLSDISLGATFLFRDEMYQAVEKRRTRYLCKRLRDNKRFLISGRAEIDVPQANGSLH